MGAFLKKVLAGGPIVLCLSYHLGTESLPTLSFLVLPSLSPLLSLLLKNFISSSKMEKSSKSILQQTVIMLIANYLINDVLPGESIYFCIAKVAIAAVTL